VSIVKTPTKPKKKKQAKKKVIAPKEIVEEDIDIELYAKELDRKYYDLFSN